MSTLSVNDHVGKVWDYLEKTYLFEQEHDSKEESIYYYLITNTIDLPIDILASWDAVLQSKINKNNLRTILSKQNKSNPEIYVHKGDITLLSIDAIVNAANNEGLGCFSYQHRCIDNIIHTKSGPALRIACLNILNKTVDKEIKNGTCIVTPGYNLPTKYVFHTVGPVYDKKFHNENCTELANCYISCLNTAKQVGIKSIAFCCVSTGVFGFPNNKAAEIAINTTKSWFTKNHDVNILVIFCTFTDKDYDLYKDYGIKDY